MIQAGTYLAKPVAGAFDNNNKNKTLGVGVQFQIKNTTEKVWWVGWLSEKAMERTCQTLALLGFDESKTPKLENGKATFDGSYFDPSAEVEIVIELEKYIAKDGTEKTRPKVQWVNQPGGSKFGKIEPQELTSELTRINFRAEIAAARKNLGLAPKKEVKNYAPGASVEPSFDEGEAIPF